MRLRDDQTGQVVFFDHQPDQRFCTSEESPFLGHLAELDAHRILKGYSVEQHIARDNTLFRQKLTEKFDCQFCFSIKIYLVY
jgi:hypothetical protein